MKTKRIRNNDKINSIFDEIQIKLKEIEDLLSNRRELYVSLGLIHSSIANFLFNMVILEKNRGSIFIENTCGKKIKSKIKKLDKKN